MKSILILLLFIGQSLCSYTQNVGALPQRMPVAIKGATIHCANGKTIQSGVIAFEAGKITILEDMRSSKILNQDKYEWIDATGKHIYPGLIALNTQLGLSEIESIKATNDFSEIGSYNPEVRALVAYNTDSRVTPTVRSNGIFLTQTAPVGGVISGMSSVMMLDGWNWEDAVYKADDAIFMYWPYLNSPTRGSNNDAAKQNPTEQFENKIRELKSFFDQAYAYSAKINPQPRNLKFESLIPVFKGERKIWVRAHDVIEIQSAVQFFEPYSIKPVIVGAQEAWKITDFLKVKNIPVVLSETHRLPMYEDDNIAQAFKTPAILADNSILFSISVDGFWQVRNLPFQVGQAIPYGLDKETALNCITINAAKILGIDKSTGSLEVGKDATILISEGDIFDMMSSKVSMGFIQGRKIDLSNKQKVLNSIYRKKYNLE